MLWTNPEQTHLHSQVNMTKHHHVCAYARHTIDAGFKRT